MAAPEVDREVFGYIPHWGMDYDFPHWELLTTVAYFAVSMDANGLATAYYDWGSDEMQNLVDEAHAHDVRLVATIQTSTTRRSRPCCPIQPSAPRRLRPASR